MKTSKTGHVAGKQIPMNCNAAVDECMLGDWQWMIRNYANLDVQTEEEKLKYLEFVQVSAIHTVLYALKAYSYAKDNSGPLKNWVQTVEGTVKIVVAPVYDKYHDVLSELLNLVDRKVSRAFYMLLMFKIRCLHFLWLPYTEVID
ncbi:hypothetical protein POM88_001145 [Heracleum sosnowskyi]|uniref:Uncharacterized protein n=1 Tax=Heracleum sosnowskyi TaxID=360622 RepID=A0AAD8JBK1_9APIA|nr:hypothetical protein POM88_001145 [Heracleum sosnowskyi]